MESKTKLYVGNLPYAVTSDALKAVFAEFGDISDAVVITDKRSGRSKGFGFVEFVNEADAQKALEAMNGKDMEGRKLVVNFARPPREDGMQESAPQTVQPQEEPAAAAEEEEVTEEEK